MTAEPLPTPPPRGASAWTLHAVPARTSNETASGNQTPRDLSLYPQFISEGIAAADRQRAAIDHVTARRMSLMLLSQTKDQQFSRDLTRFASNGAITKKLKQSLRHYARTPGHPHRHQSWRLLLYAASRDRYLGPLGPDFTAACDQADQADTARITNPPGRAAGNAAKAPEAAPPSSLWRAPRGRCPDYVIVMCAADWAIDDDYPVVLTPEDLAEDLDDMDMWEQHQWELDHEIE